MKVFLKSAVTFILITLLFLGVYAQKTQTSKRVYTNSMDNNEYTEVSSYYFDENDNKILHGKTITTCNVNNVYDANNSYAKTYNETITYLNGKKDGAYSYYDKLARKDLIELNRRKRVVERFLEESKTGSYKSGKLDGEWTISKKEKMINPFTGDENSELSKKITFKAGKVIGCAQDNYNVTFADTIGLPIILLKGNYCISGQYEKYKISKNLVTNLFLRGNTEENIDEKTQNLIKDIFSDSFFESIPSISEDSIMKLIEQDFEN
ncbi:MAG: hypothetical protein K6F29_03805 [Bacteroidales bacterium]|nr:hypothetical protein [Bacteroidales bacterium]